MSGKQSSLNLSIYIYILSFFFGFVEKFLLSFDFN